MRKLLVLLIGLTCALLSFADEEHIYLSPSGSDVTGDGTEKFPFHSFPRTIKAVMSAQPSTDTLFVEITPGDYFLDQPIRLVQANPRPVVFRSTRAEMPRILGAVPVNGWEKWNDHIWRVYVPQSQNGLEVTQFFVGGQRATLARTPNTGYFAVESLTEQPLAGELYHSPLSCYKVQPLQEQVDIVKALPLGNFRYQPKVRFYFRWDTWTVYLHNRDRKTGTFYVTGDGSGESSPLDGTARYYLFDYLDALDSPGEWYLDRSTGYLYYWPREGENLQYEECFIPTTQQLIEMNGVRDVSFRHLSLHYNLFKRSPRGEETAQGGALSEGAVIADNVERVDFTDCEVMHTANFAIWWRENCLNTRVEHCYLADLGAGGVKIGSLAWPDLKGTYTGHNTVNNCIITGGGKETPAAVGVNVLYSAYNEITHNEISDFRYSGVSLGFIWDYRESPTHHNHVAFNHIHHLGWGELGDMGGVYTLGVSDGTVIENNVIHDVVSYGYGSWGLYTDGASANILWRNNLAYHCKTGGFHQDLGRENIFENNIFALGYQYQCQFTFREDHLSFTFRNNIILQDEGTTMDGDRWYTGNTVIEKNLYWTLGKTPLLFCDKDDFQTWRQKKEPTAVCADPMFVDPKNADFHFRSLKNVRKIGFKPFDYTQAGVYGSNEWKQRASLPETIQQAFEQATAPYLYYKPKEW